MALITAQQMVERYMQAEADVLDGKTIMFNGTSHTHEDIEKIRVGRREWEQRVWAQAHPCRPLFARATFE